MIEHRVIENWAVVTEAIRLRMQQLGMSQAQLIARSSLSKAMVGELVRGKTVRHRNPRTLAAMSEALEWHRDHLECLLWGEVPPTPSKPKGSLSLPLDKWEEIAARLANIERRLNEIGRKIT